ncbi:MAG: histidine-type phosphatase [Muribaculaceae bacterium]|nr:histidine-type phosphatase [Muribaculaceae bacterium]
MIWNKVKFLSNRMLVISILLLPLSVQGKIYVDGHQAGSQYLAYPVNDSNAPQLSAAPAGYVPFHIEHYGRHGSRWRLKMKDYTEPVELLQKAQKDGKLTPRGETLLEQLTIIADDANNRTGELTPLGHRQHREIAARMARNFPEIFNNSTLLDAKSTVVIRCILSMANEMAEFQKLFPGMKINMDASYTTQKTLAYNSTDTVAKKISRGAKHHVEDYAASLPKPEAFFEKLFTDRQYVADSIGEQKIFDAIFDVAVNMQSHDDYPEIFDVFTAEELNNEWLARNADWYISAGNTPLTNNRVPYNQRVLLKNIIESADTAMNSPHISANLRFGHESILLPLSVLMELGNSAYETTDLTTLADNWRNYEIFPMGSNIQMIFYRPKKAKKLSEDDVLVKVLLNEAEVSLPGEPTVGNYYSWKNLKEYYLNKLDDFSVKFAE